MSEFEGFDQPIPSDEEIEAVKRQGPKQVAGPNDEPPALMRASDLLPPEPEPPQEFDEETPPAPTFIVVRNAYGPGAHSVKFADGTPVGVWARETGWIGAQVEAHLLALGLDADLAAWFGKQRDGGIAADREIAAHPAVAAFAKEEERRKQAKEATSAAFLAAYKKKQKEKA